MYIEDLINRLASDGIYLFYDRIEVLPSDVSIISSLSNQIVMGNGFTEKQSILAVRLAKKYSRQLSLSLSKDVSSFVDSPLFKLPIRVLNNSKIIKIHKSSKSNKKIISVIFPYDENLVTAIKNHKRLLSQTGGAAHTISWNPETKSWDFDLREELIDFIANNLVDSSFFVDDEFKSYAEQIETVKKSMEDYVPMVVFEDNKFVFKNISKNVPQPENFDLINVLLDARQYGITTWGEDIDLALKDLAVSPILFNFLTEPTSVSLQNSKVKYQFSDICDVIENVRTSLVVIPGGNELKNLETCMKRFQERGVTTDQMSVLFRLSGETGKNFNNFVKDNKLNNPISEKIKIFFISGKVPKPLIEQKVNFSVILNLGLSGVHYTLSNFLKNHHFVINYSLKEIDFAKL